MANLSFLLAVLALSLSLVLAVDQSTLQDFCVARPNGQVLVNGLICKDPKLVDENDFFFSGLHGLGFAPAQNMMQPLSSTILAFRSRTNTFSLSPYINPMVIILQHGAGWRIRWRESVLRLHIAGNTTNPVGSRVTSVTAAQLPGLNTLGISIVRIDYAPWGINPPHTHPRATEILTVLDGTLEVGFITSNPENRHIRKVLQKGDVFVFPIGLVHYQRNVGYGNAVAIAALSSQNPGVITIANAVFGSTPDIANDVLVKAFQSDKTTVSHLQSKF